MEGIFGGRGNFYFFFENVVIVFLKELIRIECLFMKLRRKCVSLI